MDRFGGGGHYDTSDEAINKAVRDEGWTVRGREHFCEECAEDQEDKL